jgi:carboxypeptidase C (cathepsin A)
MYPTTNEDSDAPAIFWLNGGPGASSMLANFLFSGPLRIA